MAGIDYLAAVMNGELPPPRIAGLMLFDATTLAPGRVVFTCTLDESMYNATGTIHGGVVYAFLIP
jgi:acyl-coenzyme A thioesterase PaaI-like protein